MNIEVTLTTKVEVVICFQGATYINPNINLFKILEDPYFLFNNEKEHKVGIKIITLQDHLQIYEMHVNYTD